MSTTKPEINLEICSGFFRINAQDAIYNITVIDTGQNKASQVVGQILAEEKRAMASALPPPVPAEDRTPHDRDGRKDENFYKQVSKDIYNDIGRLAKSLSSTMLDIPAEDRRMKRAELDEAGEKIEDAKRQLRDIVSMTERATMEIMDQVEKVQGQTDDVKELLSQLKEHAAFKAAAEAESVAQDETAAGSAKELRETLLKTKELLSGLHSSGAEAALAPAPPTIQTEKKKRYLFVIDTVFQTIYELCTNEAVKGHISAARSQAAEIFDNDIFVDTMTEKAQSLEADADNFYTFPLSGVFQSLLAACSEKKIKNLLTKMDANQGEIFLDQSLPLEVPPIEEIEVEIADLTLVVEPVPSEMPGPSISGPRYEELAGLVETGLVLAAAVEEEIAKMRHGSSPSSMSMMSLEDQQEIFMKIERAFNVAMGICDDVTRITEALSFQDLSGQQILKIIKLLGDFQVQLLAIVVTFGSQLKSKERDATISLEESKRLAQEEVDKYLGATVETAAEGPLDQDTVNKMLEEMGF